MKFKAEIDVMPLEALLDPQGKAVQSGLKNMGLNAVQNVRIGKHISLEIEASTQEEAEKIATQACEQLLCNKVMEFYQFTVAQI